MARIKERNSEEFLEDLTRLYQLGHKSFVIYRNDVEHILELLLKKKRIDKGSKIAQKYIDRYLKENE